MKHAKYYTYVLTVLGFFFYSTNTMTKVKNKH